ncbi:MAG: glycosyltransferase family 2 protein, partial [Pseudomonadales bacterium]|nr:glycosyltransferase family 2 protein [Pseudomonadales bacterium]
PRCGLAGSLVHGVDGVLHTTSFNFPSIMGECDSNLRLGLFTRLIGYERVIAIPTPSEATPVDWVAGCSLLIRREVIERVGMFDEGFFLYYEETDLCLRAAREGFETWFVPDASVAHVGSASTNFQDHSKPRARYWFESRNRYFRKNHGRTYLLLANVAWVISFALWRVRQVLQRIPDVDPPRFLRDFIRYSVVGYRPTEGSADGA